MYSCVVLCVQERELVCVLCAYCIRVENVCTYVCFGEL